MQLKFDRAKWVQDNEGFWLSLQVKSSKDARQFIDEMKDKLYVAELKEYREKRSLDANAYFWVLAGKLSAKTQIPVSTIYRQYIRDIGGNYQIVPIRDDAKEQWIEAWAVHGIGWICDDLGASKIEGYSNIICYYGSSVYDTAQMSRLIDFVVQDCKDQGIETMTPEELERLKAAWES